MNTNTKLALLATCSFAMPTLAEAKEKPNLLFIVTDEQSFRTLGCYRDLLPKDQAEMWGEGNVVETPNLDRIAKSGVLFNKMYTSSPVSTPARATMFTGFYGVQLGMPNNSSKAGDGKYLKAEVPTIAQSLQKAGYKTGYIGKWHLAESIVRNRESKKEEHEYWQPHPVGHEGYNYGFEDNRYMFNGGHGKFIGMNEDGTPYFGSPKSVFVKNDESGLPIYKDEKGDYVRSTNDFLTDRAIDFIDENSDDPFYCVVSIPDPHTPDQALGKYSTMYTDMKFEFPKTYQKSAPEGTPAWRQPDGKANKITKMNLAQYFGMVKHIDDCVGRMIDKLESEGVLENTIIVFTSDHGEMMGEFGRMNKGVIQEASSRVAFIMSHGIEAKKPLVPRGKVVNLAANTADWMPTFLSLCGAECPKVMGRDLTPILDGSTPKGWNNVTFSTKAFISAIDSRYKLYLEPGKRANDPWLLDMEKDPFEKDNHINNPENDEVVVRLAKELLKFNKEVTGDDKDMRRTLEKLIADRK